MSNLTIIAHITAKIEHLEKVQAALLGLITVTQTEQGCVRYDLHQDQNNPNHFMFYEKWESRELWEQHMQAPHLTDFMKTTDGLVEDVRIYEMDQISPNKV